MVEHYLKIVDPYFTDVKEGRKTFEIRNNDRDFTVGDIVNMRLFDYNEGKFIGNNVIKKKITYVTDYNQRDGYVVFGIGELDNNGQYKDRPQGEF